MNNGKLHIGCLFLSSILKNEYNHKGILDHKDDIISLLENDVKVNVHFNEALDNLKKIVQGFAGQRKEGISTALRRQEVDERVSRFIHREKFPATRQEIQTTS
jgi:hypothetical protein